MPTADPEPTGAGSKPVGPAAAARPPARDCSLVTDERRRSMRHIDVRGPVDQIPPRQNTAAFDGLLHLHGAAAIEIVNTASLTESEPASSPHDRRAIACDFKRDERVRKNTYEIRADTTWYHSVWRLAFDAW